jgi:hypothetical protein
MKRSLKARVTRLEAILPPLLEPSCRIGFIRKLPEDYIGERHVAIVKHGECDKYGREPCEFEERPGPAPRGPRDRVHWLYFTETQMRICGDPIED